MALAARLVPAAECLETVRENLVSTATQPGSAREQMLRAEAHLSFAQLHMAAAQRFQTPAEEMSAPSSAPSIPAGAQLVRALTEARGFEAAASAPQASWTREALRRTAGVSYVALEACEVAAQTSWTPWECGTYHDLLDREERRLDEAFGGMMPDELPGAVVAVAEVWLDDAYDNITMAQACLAMRRDQEKRRIATPGEHPEPPDGETSAEKARRLWIPRAFQQTSYVSDMAREICDDSTKTNRGAWLYRERRGLLDEEMATACRIYAEVELADPPVRDGKEAKGASRRSRKQAEGQQPRPDCGQAGQLGRRGGLSWREKRTLGPRGREAAGKEVLPTHVHPTEPRWTWWIQPASPTLQTQEECRSFLEDLGLGAPARQSCRACCCADKRPRGGSRQGQQWSPSPEGGPEDLPC